MDYKKEWQGLKEYLHNGAYAHDNDPLIRYVCKQHYECMVELENNDWYYGKGYEDGLKKGYERGRETERIASNDRG